MALYMYINEYDRYNYKQLTFEEDVNEAFKEALKYDCSLLMSSYEMTIKGFWRNKVETRYQIYHDVNPNEPPYQARYQMSASGRKEPVIAYLHGIVNGAIAAQNKV